MELPTRPPEKRTISDKITLAPKREGEKCAFRKSCDADCFLVRKKLALHKRSKDELMRAINSRLEDLNIFTYVGEEGNAGTRNRMARRLTEMLQGAMVPIDYGGTVDMGTCGKHFPIQTYTIAEMQELVEGNPLELEISNAYVSCSRLRPPSGLGEAYADLLAWIAAIKKGERSAQMETLIKSGGAGGMRAISRIIGEPAIDEETRKHFMVSIIILASCASIEEDKVLAGNEELALHLSRFSPFGIYGDMRIVGEERRRDCECLPAPPLPEKPVPSALRQMKMVAVGELFRAVMNIANRIDSVVCAEDCAVQENVERIRGMHETMKMGLRFLGDGKAIREDFLEGFADRKIHELYGHVPVGQRGLGMDAGEQAVARYVIAQLQKEHALDNDSVGQILRILAANDEHVEERVERLKAIIPA